MAGAIFGEVGVTLFIAGAAFPEIFGDSRCQDGTSKVSQATGEDFMLGLSSDHGRLTAGVSSDYPRIVFLLAEAIPGFLGQILYQNFVTGAIFGDVGGPRPCLRSEKSKLLHKFVTHIHSPCCSSWRHSQFKKCCFTCSHRRDTLHALAAVLSFSTSA